MIQELSSRVAKWMEQEGVISVKDKELFSYAVYSLLFGLLPIFIVVVLGLALGMLQEGLLMITPFMLIRKFSGGYHLDSSRLCVILSTALLTIAMVLIKVVAQGGHIIFLTVLVILSVICLCAFSPVENHSRKLTCKERRLFRKIACFLAVAAIAVYLIMYKTVSTQYTVALGVGILLAAILQAPYAIASTKRLHCL